MAPKGFTRTQIRLHWVIVALVVVMYLTGDAMEEGGSGGALAAIHIWAGALIIPVMIVRLYIRASRGAPPAPDGEPAFLRSIARGTVWIFYMVLVAIPVGGLMEEWGGVKAGFVLHEAFEPLLFILIWLHFAAAMVHHFVFKNDVLRRMLRPE